MQTQFANQLLQVLSAERLNAYRGRLAPTASDREVLGRYAWNMSLSESLYPSLQILEIALRNTIHRAASAEYGQANWFDLANVLQHHHERDAISKAKATLSQQNKPLDASRIVAEVNFGFWTSLLDRRYEQTLWPRLLKPAFPHMPRQLRTRANLSKQFHRVRQLRNRVFHHEPIWHWHDLAQQHNEILKAIFWIEPAAQDFVRMLDRFPSIHAQGSAQMDVALQKFC
jgi:hypothetical protein